MSFSRETFKNIHSKLITNGAPDAQIKALEQLAIMNFSSNKQDCKLLLESLGKLAKIESVDYKLTSSIMNCFENCVKYVSSSQSISAMLPFIYHNVYNQNEALRKSAIQMLKSIVNNERYDSTEELRKEIFKSCKDMMPKMISMHDSKYLETFDLTLELLGKRLNVDIPILNGMLKLEQEALLSKDEAFQIQALIAWKKVIDTFSLYHQVFENPKRIALIMKPLLRPGGESLGIINAKIDVWLHLLSKFNLEILCFESTIVGMCSYIASLGHYRDVKNRFVSIFTKLICGPGPQIRSTQDLRSVPFIPDDLFIKNYPKMLSFFEVSMTEDVDSDLKHKIICSFIKRLVIVCGSEELDYTIRSNKLQKSEIRDICSALGREAEFMDFTKENLGNKSLQSLLEYLLDVLIDMNTIAKWSELAGFAMISVQCSNKPYAVIQLLLQKMHTFTCSTRKSDFWMLITNIAINYVTCTESCNLGKEFDPCCDVMKNILIEPFVMYQKSNKEGVSPLMLKKSDLRDLWNQLYRLAHSAIDLEGVASSKSFRKHLFKEVLKYSLEENSLYGSFLLSSLKFAYSEMSCVKPSKKELMILYKLLNKAASCDLDTDDCKSFLTFMKYLVKILSRDSIYSELAGNCVNELNLAGDEGTVNVVKLKNILKNYEALLTNDEEELKKRKNIEEKMRGPKALEHFTSPNSAKKSTVTSAGKVSEVVENTAASSRVASSSSKTPVKHIKENDKPSQELTIRRNSSKKQMNEGLPSKVEQSTLKSSKELNQESKGKSDTSRKESHIQTVGKNLSEIEEKSDISTPRTQSSKTPIKSNKKKVKAPKETNDDSSKGNHIQTVGKNLSEIEDNTDVNIRRTPSSKTLNKSSQKKDEEFVVIPSTPRSRVLTERQKEKLKEQKRDIPAMYNDYSQDSMLISTNSSQSQSLLSECKSVTNSSTSSKMEISENKSTQKSTTKNGLPSNDRRQSKRRKIEFSVEQIVVEENAVSSPFKVETNALSDQLPVFNLNDAKSVRFESPPGTKVALTTDDDEFVPRKRKIFPTPFKITSANGSKFEESKSLVSPENNDEIYNLSALFNSPIRNSPATQTDQKKTEELNDSDNVMQKKKVKMVCLEMEGKENSIFKEPLVDQQSSVVNLEKEEKLAIESSPELDGSKNGKRSKKRDRKSELPLRSLRSAGISGSNSPSFPEILKNKKTKIKPAVVLSSSRRGRSKKYVDTPRPVGSPSAKVKPLKGNDPVKRMFLNIDSSPGLQALKQDNLAETALLKTTKAINDSKELNLDNFSKAGEYDSADELISKDNRKKRYLNAAKAKKKNQSPTLENNIEVNKTKYLDAPKSPEKKSECEIKILKPGFSVNDMLGEETSETGGDEEKEECLDGYAIEPRPSFCEKSPIDNKSPVRNVFKKIDESENTTEKALEVCEENIRCPEVMSTASLPSPADSAPVLQHMETSFVSDCESESSLPLSVLQLRCRARKESKALLKCNETSSEHENIDSCSSKIYSDEDLPFCSVTDVKTVKSLSNTVASDSSDLPSPSAASVSELSEKTINFADSSEGQETSELSEKTANFADSLEGQETLLPSKLDGSYTLNGESVSYSVMSVIDSKKIRLTESCLEEDTNLEPQQASECELAPESVDLFSEPPLRVSPRRTPRKSPSKPYDKDIADTVKCSLKFEGSPQKSSGPSPSSEKKAEKITATHLTPYKQSKLGRMPSLSGRSAQLVVLAQAKGKQMEKEIQDAKKLSPSISDLPEVQNNGGDPKPQSPAKPWKRHSYSPNASPSSSILKRKLSDEDNVTPPSKSRKVTFRTPEVSDQVQVPRKEERDSTPRLRRRSLGKQLSVASDEELVEKPSLKPSSPEKPSLAATTEQLEETLQGQVASFSPSESDTSLPSHLPKLQGETIFPELMDCTDEVGRLTCVLASGPWVKMLNRKLKERNILTVGQLCSLPPSEIEKLDIQPPKIPKAKSAMQKFFLEWNKGVVKHVPNLAKSKLLDCQGKAEEFFSVPVPMQLPLEIEHTLPSQDNSEMDAKSIAGNDQNCLATQTVLSDATTTELSDGKAEFISTSTQTDNTNEIEDEYFLLDDHAKAAVRNVISSMRKLMEKPSSS